MLCFLFAALIVALDQFFKQWILRTLDVGEVGPEIIPGVLGLTRWENDGAMLNILSGQQWLLAGVAFIAAIVLVMILLRYNEGFWGTLGLAAVLGGTVGNLADRIFNDGRVVDMFRTLFVNFPIFNIADIFITLGFVTFLIHFIALSFSSGDDEEYAEEYANDDYYDEYEEPAYDEFPDNPNVSSRAQQDYGSQTRRDSYGAQNSQRSQSSQRPQSSQRSQYAPESQYDQGQQYAPEQQYMQDPQYAPDEQYMQEPVMPMSNDYQSLTDISSDSSLSLDDLTSDLESYEDYDIDDLLREYGIDNDDN